MNYKIVLTYCNLIGLLVLPARSTSSLGANEAVRLRYVDRLGRQTISNGMDVHLNTVTVCD